MNSSIKVIVDKKTSHIRELVVNQKRSKKVSKRSHNAKKPNYPNFNSNSKNFNSHQHNNYTTHGYDNIKHKSFNSRISEGKVTVHLQKFIENQCHNSKVN